MLNVPLIGSLLGYELEKVLKELSELQDKYNQQANLSVGDIEAMSRGEAMAGSLSLLTFIRILGLEISDPTQAAAALDFIRSADERCGI